MSRRHDIDFARPPSASPWAWALLVAGMVALGTTAAVLERGWSRHHDATDRAERLQLALQRQVPAQEPARELRRTSSQGSKQVRDAAQGKDTPTRAEATRIWADLHRPWMPLLDRVESLAGRDRQLTHVTVNGTFTEALIQAEARDLADAWRVVRDLDTGAPIRAVQMLQHEWREGEEAPRVVAFRMRATLAANPSGSQAQLPASSRQAMLDPTRSAVRTSTEPAAGNP